MIVIPVILCGGSGTRLWPASRADRPKQFLSLMDEGSLLQNTLSRAMKVAGCKPEQLVTVTLDSFADEVATQLSSVDPAATRHILREPAARNTAAAVAFAASYIKRVFGGNTLMWVLPADHHVADEAALALAFREAKAAAEENWLVTFGIPPTRPETGFGYIRPGTALPGGKAQRVEGFFEKPDAATAKTYIAAGNLWNSGMFLFSTDAVLAEFAQHAPAILEKAGMNNPEAYLSIDNISFDKAIMEKSARVAVVPCDPGWSDIGTWDSLWAMREKDGNGNAVTGNVACEDTHGCLIQGNGRLIACAGVENLVIIDTGDAILIADRRDPGALQSLVRSLEKSSAAKGRRVA